MVGGGKGHNLILGAGWMGGRHLLLVPSFVCMLSVALAQGNGQKAVLWPLELPLTLTSARLPEHQVGMRGLTWALQLSCGN